MRTWRLEKLCDKCGIQKQYTPLFSDDDESFYCIRCYRGDVLKEDYLHLRVLALTKEIEELTAKVKELSYEECKN